MAMQEDPRRRGGGTGGAGELPGQLNAFGGGVPQWDYSGPMARSFAGAGGAQGNQGLISLLAQGGPSMRHFGNQGFYPPGLVGNQSSQNAIGGPNVAPGNTDTGLALGQPGVPQGVARGQSGAMPPGHQMQTQGWLNYAPGFKQAASAGFGAPGGQGPGASYGGSRGVPSTGVAEAPMPGHAAGGGGGGGQQQAAVRDNFGGGGRGGGGGGQGGGGGGGNKGPSGIYNDGDPTNNPGYQATARGGTQGGATATTQYQGTIQQQQQQAQNNAYSNAQQGVASGTFGDTIHAAPNNGNNNTPAETQHYVAPTTGKKKSAGGTAAKKTNVGAFGGKRR